MINPLESSIFILDKINFKLQESYNLTVKAESTNLTEAENAQLFYYMMEYGMVLALSYMDELRLHFYPNLKKVKSSEYVKGLKRMTGFLVTEINTHFPDLKKFRDHYLAHNMRVKEIDNVFVNGGLRKYKVPQNMLDYTLLIQYILIIDNILELEFPNAVKNFQKFQASTSATIPIFSPVHGSEEAAKAYLIEITEEAQRRYSIFQIQIQQSPLEY